MGAASFLFYILAPLIYIGLPCLILAFFLQLLPELSRTQAFFAYLGLASLTYLGFWLYTNPENAGIGFMFLLPASPVLAFIYLLPEKLVTRIIKVRICRQIQKDILAGQVPSRVFRKILADFRMAKKINLADLLLCAFPKLDEEPIIRLHDWHAEPQEKDSDDKLDKTILKYLVEAGYVLSKT